MMLIVGRLFRQRVAKGSVIIGNFDHAFQAGNVTPELIDFLLLSQDHAVDRCHILLQLHAENFEFRESLMTRGRVAHLLVQHNSQCMPVDKKRG